ncbi:SRPBCC family protein [Kocuria rosea]|uniref:SRPBCC family protein n=1 Tax=Kocuria rosea TaxID=1275 RepID=UPI00203E00C8|nr:SRPBCC family protein [Kocuria rosea]MCM3686644.1 SRPBCC family protein [Kocuria rosea]
MGHPLHLAVPDGVPYIDFEREFDFPVAEVFRAHADPALLDQWLGPRGTHVEVDHWDFRTGGGYHYHHTGPDGVSYSFRGVLHTVRENELVVQTFEFGGYPDSVELEFLAFEDLGDGRCRLHGHTIHPSLEARDGMAASGMESGMSDGYERLEELLAAARTR